MRRLVETKLNISEQKLKVALAALRRGFTGDGGWGGHIKRKTPQKGRDDGPRCSIHVSVDLLQERMQRRILRLLDLLHQLRVLGDQLPQVGQLLQKLGEEEGVVRVVGQQVEPQDLHDALLHTLDVAHVHQAGPVCTGKKC